MGKSQQQYESGHGRQGNVPAIHVFQRAVNEAKPKFIAMQSGLDWEKESLYALQQFQKNWSLQETAQKNPESVRMAMVNVAAVGLTLNPAVGDAFLVPRDGRVVLDISYKGLIRIGTDSGSILWAKAVLVHETDTFEYRGVSREPKHICNPFDKNRGKPIGVYCIAKTPDGDYLVEPLPESDIEAIRSMSKAYENGQGPWVGPFDGEMWKKAAIKRASKTWPKTDRRERLATAVHVLNEHEGLREEFLSNGAIESYDASKIPESVKGKVVDVVTRARNTGAFAAARDWVEERFGPGPYRAYALDQLNLAQH